MITIYDTIYRRLVLLNMHLYIGVIISNFTTSPVQNQSIEIVFLRHTLDC